MPSFDPFRRFRLRSHPVPTLPSSNEEDTDDSSPERDQPHIIHVPVPKNGRRSGERLLSIPENGKKSLGAPEKTPQSTHIAITLDKAPHPSHPELPSGKPSKPGVAMCVYLLSFLSTFISSHTVSNNFLARLKYILFRFSSFNPVSPIPMIPSTLFNPPRNRR